MKETTCMLFSTISASALFLLLYLFLHWTLIVCILLCIGIYFGLYFLLRPCRKTIHLNIEGMPEREELQSLLNDAYVDLEKIDQSIQAIKAPAAQTDARSLYNTGMKILSYLKDNPEKIKLARRFFIYYLDTAVKLLSQYVGFQDTGLHSPEIVDILNKMTEALPILNKAFEKQFAHLMEGELLDVEADLELLKSTLKMEEGK